MNKKESARVWVEDWLANPEAYKCSQSELARKAGVSRQRISQILNPEPYRVRQARYATKTQSQKVWGIGDRSTTAGNAAS